MTRARANINRPIAGPTHDKVLPVGKRPFQLYSLGTPNGVKVTVMFEELLAAGHSGAEYDAWLINIGNGDQFGSGFVEINPNSKIPALLDRSAKPARGCSSRAPSAASRREIRRVSAEGPRETTESGSTGCSGRWAARPIVRRRLRHFYAYAPMKIEYAIDRFAMETKRQLDVLDRHLARRTNIYAGDEYSIADMAVLPWYGGTGERPALQQFGHVPVGAGLHPCELAAKAAELEAKLRQAEERGESETGKAQGLAAQVADLEAKLRQAEQSAQSEAGRAQQLAATVADLASRLKTIQAADAAPAPLAQPPASLDAAPDGGLEGSAPALPPIPALEPVLESGWSRALAYMRQSLSAAYARLRKLSATPLAEDQRAQLKAAASALAQGTDTLTTLGEFWDDAGPAPSLARLEPAVAAAVGVWEPALRRRGISLARRQDASQATALFHPEGLRLALYQLLRNAYECMPGAGR